MVSIQGIETDQTKILTKLYKIMKKTVGFRIIKVELLKTHAFAKNFKI